MFRIFCFVLFLYQAAMSIDVFQNQKPSSNPKYENQENYPRPTFCFSKSKFDYSEVNTVANITFTQYRWGKWRTEDFTEEELFNYLSPTLSSMITKIQINRNTDPISNSYEKITIPIPKQNTNLKEVRRQHIYEHNFPHVKYI